MSKLSMKPRYLIINLLILILIGECTSTSEDFFGACDESFTCGTISGFGYPFRRQPDPPYCGNPSFELNCDEGNPPTINIMNLKYHVLDFDPTAQILKLIREDMINSNCPQNQVSTTIDHEIFEYAPSYKNISFLFGCTGPPNGIGMGSVICRNGPVSPVFLWSGVQGPGSCRTSVVTPVPVGFVDPARLGEVVREGFEIRWKVDTRCTSCMQSGGRCMYDNIAGVTMCACPEPTFLAEKCPATNKTEVGSSPSSGDSKSQPLTIIFPTIGAVLVGVGLGWGLFVCRRKRKRRITQTESKSILTSDSSKGLTSNTRSNFTSSIPSYRTSKTSLEFGKCSYFGAQVFTYEELEIATNNFDDSRELGDGGYGTVYHGKLLDGREVAVKRLYENNFRRVEQFMNEVEILTRLNHENLVKLYGCTSKRSRELLLVYEYIPNGTVADHLHRKLGNSNSNSCLLTWSVRLKIAIETAEALAYLHESDIIHRDVKTTNILLDKSFQVKVADFGLSRLFPTNCTHVSTAPQGTPGYVDPAYYLCYHLTDKSDVYSFGVVLIELISSLQAVDTNRDRLDINLAAMAINKIQNHMLDELVDKSIGFGIDGSARRMITLVAELAFRCLQQEADMRPAMKEVVEVLKGIQNEELNVQKPEVLDIVVDDGGLFKDQNTEPPSPEYGITNRLVNGSIMNSSDG